MGAALGILIGVLFLGGLIWLENRAARLEAEEDARLREEIKHLPADMQVRLWAAHMRAKADRDLL